MKKVSILDLDSAVKCIMEQEMGILLLEADEKSMYDVLAEQTSFADRKGMYGNGSSITFHLYPLMYKKNREDITIVTDLMRSRANAVSNIFKRWTSCGYNKHHAKEPFASKAFNKYLDGIEFNKADYMLLRVE